MILLVSWTGSADLSWLSWGQTAYYSLTHVSGISSGTAEMTSTAGATVHMISHSSEV